MQAHPHAPPRTDPLPLSTPTSETLAPLGRRLGGALLDGILALVAVLPGYVMMVAASSLETLETSMLVMEGGWLLLMAVQWYLVATSGQSIGKRWIGIRIVRTDGRPVGFVHGVVLRSWVFLALAFVPVLGEAVGFEVLTIFGAARRCLHDYVADTKVVVA